MIYDYYSNISKQYGNLKSPLRGGSGPAPPFPIFFFQLTKSVVQMTCQFLFSNDTQEIALMGMLSPYTRATATFCITILSAKANFHFTLQYQQNIRFLTLYNKKTQSL